MTPWIMLFAACLLTATLAFMLVRSGFARFSAPAPAETRTPAPRAATPSEIALLTHTPPASTAVDETPVAEPPRTRTSERRSVPPGLRSGRTAQAPSRSAPRYRTAIPVPTAPQPEEHKLVLWASQIEVGARKMTVATDGCRVTWDRRCKHGHPSWLVELEYLTV